MNSSKNSMLSKNVTATALLCAVCLMAISPSPVAAQTSDADVYEHVGKPAEERREAEIRDIMSRPSNWGPGEIRSNVNYGGISWYKKPGGDYGYIVVRGYVSPTSAKVQMNMECYDRNVACEGTQMLTNEWLVIAKRSDGAGYITASAQSRKDAEAMAKDECAKSDVTCSIQDAFDVMFPKRGIGHMWPKVKQR